MGVTPTTNAVYKEAPFLAREETTISFSPKPVDLPMDLRWVFASNARRKAICKSGNNPALVLSFPSGVRAQFVGTQLQGCVRVATQCFLFCRGTSSTHF